MNFVSLIFVRSYTDSYLKDLEQFASPCLLLLMAKISIFQFLLPASLLAIRDQLVQSLQVSQFKLERGVSGSFVICELLEDSLMAKSRKQFQVPYRAKIHSQLWFKQRLFKVFLYYLLET